jgi:galactokinase/mevalonate kinase-like predicted kinase
MKEYIQRLLDTDDLAAAREYIEAAILEARNDRLSARDRGAFLRALLLNNRLLDGLGTATAIDHLLSRAGAEWNELFGGAAHKILPATLTELIDSVADVSHLELLRLVGDDNGTKPLLAVLKSLDSYLVSTGTEIRLLKGMRVARVMVDVYRRLVDEKVWRRRRVPACCIDNGEIRRLKEKKDVAQLPAAYETRINSLQREDLERCLQALADRTTNATGESDDEVIHMQQADFGKTFEITAPLRIGISSANASDNHIRTKEQGGKTMNAGIDLMLEGNVEAIPPLVVSARRLDEPRLVLRSLSTGFKADFEANARGDAAAQSELFFAYRRGGDESLRMVKQALVHTGIVAPSSADVVSDITRFTEGGGIEISTSSQVLQGSGLGTSSILAAAILKLLNRLIGSAATTAGEDYPALYDQSLLLEQSLGLNSGWQDARGACGGPSAVKDFYAPPTDGLPTPEISFVDVDEETFIERVVLFDTGIARAATRGLNVVLEAYLSRCSQAYPAVRESLVIHDEIVDAMRAGDYASLGRLATRYWQLRCQLDPGATSDTIQYLFESEELSSLSEGGLLTGAGGGGFAIIIAKEGEGHELGQRLANLAARQAYAASRVVAYRLNRSGFHLKE